MSNKVFNHKLTVLSVSLLALFLGGCGGGSGGVNTGATGGAKAPVVDAGAGKGTDAGAGKGTDAGTGTDAGAGKGTDAGTGKGADTGVTDAGKGTDTGTDAGTGKGADAGAGKGTDTGVTDAGKGTDTGTDAGAGKGPDVTPPKPEVKTPELIKADNPNLPTENLLGAKKSYTELSGYSFTTGANEKEDGKDVKATKGLLAKEIIGSDNPDQVEFQSAIETDADGKKFTPDPKVVGVKNINLVTGEDYSELESWDQGANQDFVPKGAKAMRWRYTLDKNGIDVITHEFDANVLLGFMRLGLDSKNQEVNLFYRAGETSSKVPADGKVVYKGAWWYATKAYDDGDGGLKSGVYSKLFKGATANIPTLELTADFSKKIITGDFKQADDNGGDNLSLNIPEGGVKISGNGFAGTAVVSNASATPNYTSANLVNGEKVDVKGAFYGGVANAVGGYLSKNKDGEQVFAGVFAGSSDLGATEYEERPKKYTNTSKPAENDQPYIDSILKVDQASGKVDLSEPQFTGDIDKLNLGDDVGVALTGIKDTGIDFQFLRLSNFAQDGSSYKFNQASLGQNGDTGYFIQGYLSSSDDVIALGQQYNKVYFAGKWLGWGKAGDKTTSAHYADARYVADFSGSDKVLNGWLYKPGSTDVSDDVKADIAKAQKAGTNFEGVSLHTHIYGNSFHTNISDKTSKINLDGVQGNVEAKGHFFGTKDNPANELGGTVVGVDGAQFGGVFAGKQVKGQSEKR